MTATASQLLPQRNLPARNIALIGFMGSGKTTVGRSLAERLRWRFVDTDHHIVERAGGKSIPILFEEEGEPAFRDRESEAVLSVCAGAGQVIATGGGAVLRPENIDALRSSSLIVWLTARPDVVVARTRRAGARSRPVLAVPEGEEGDEEALLARVLTLLSERGPRYQAVADLIVDTSERGPSAIAAEIHRKWERRRHAFGHEASRM